MWFGKWWPVWSTQLRRKQQIFVKWIDRKPEVHQDSCYYCGICFKSGEYNVLLEYCIKLLCYCLFTIAKHRAKAIKPCFILHSPKLPLFSLDNLFPNSISMCFKMTYAPYVRCHEQANRSRAMQGSCSDDFICSRSIKIKQQKKTSSSSSSKISNNIHPTKEIKNTFTLEGVQFYIWFTVLA